MLREWRKRAKRTLAELAAECETSEASISRIERGDQTPSLSLAVKLEHVTGIPAREFLPKEPQP
jgi:transcriptional regulator with XRE-family HTH domain